MEERRAVCWNTRLLNVLYIRILILIIIIIIIIIIINVYILLSL